MSELYTNRVLLSSVVKQLLCWFQVIFPIQALNPIFLSVVEFSYSCFNLSKASLVENIVYGDRIIVNLLFVSTGALF